MRNSKAKNKQKKNTSASLHIRSLNMRGQSRKHPEGPFGTWGEINHTSETHKIGVLAIQEAHLTSKAVSNLVRKTGQMTEHNEVDTDDRDLRDAGSESML